MKVVKKDNVKKQKVKKKPIVKTKKEQILIVAQEIKFARLLSGNEKKTRDRALKTLKKWLLNCFERKYDFKEDDFARIWKGLFYAVWMSDKPLIQEELCDNIAGILDLFPADQVKYALMMVKVGLRVIASEWYGIDQHRMDKCLMLVRRYLRGSFRYLLRCGWKLQSCKKYSNMLAGNDGILALKTPVYARNAVSMILHITDCYLEELAKVSNGDVPADSLAELLRPFCAYICGGEVPVLCAASRRVLTALVRQSAPGLRYEDKTRAWKQMGCPAGGPDALELVSDDEENGDVESGDDEDSREKPLDPRAGRVDVELPTLAVPCQQLVSILKELIASAGSKAHRRARICLQRFQQLAREEYPLKMQPPPIDEAPPIPRARRAAKDLQVLEKGLVLASDELALRGLSRKHRKRLLAKSREGLSIVEDVEAARADVSAKSTNGDWQVEAEPEKKKLKEDTSNKENVIKKNKKQKLQQKQNGVLNRQKQNGDVKKHKENGDVKRHKENGDVKRHKENGDMERHKENGDVKRHKETGDVKMQKLVSEIKKNKNKKGVIGLTEKRKVLNGVTDKHENAPALIREKKIVKNEKHLTEVGKKQEEIVKIIKPPSLVVNKVKNFQKQLSPKEKVDKKTSMNTPKKVKFVLKNNSMQGPVDYYKSVRQSPNIPFDSSKKPSKTNLKPSTPSPINPFFKKKLKLKK